MKRYEKTDYVDIDTGEILNYKNLKNDVYKIEQEKTEIKKQNGNEYIKTTKFIRFIGRQQKLW